MTGSSQNFLRARINATVLAETTWKFSLQNWWRIVSGSGPGGWRIQ